MSDALVTFSPAQLALAIVILAAALMWSVRFGFTRMIASIDEQFDSLRNDIKDIRSNHPTRPEVTAQIDGVHRRISDLRARHREESGSVS